MRPARRLFARVALAAAGMGIAGGLLRAQAPRVVQLRTRKFVFEPAEIVLRRREPVLFEFSAADVTMGWSCPDLGLRSDVVPGKTLTLAFTPDKAGTFDFVCDVFCGDDHEDMHGHLKVT